MKKDVDAELLVRRSGIYSKAQRARCVCVCVDQPSPRPRKRDRHEASLVGANDGAAYTCLLFFLAMHSTHRSMVMLMGRL